jgi:long-subunit acyl-CoA synthetase (AMP-forming)
LETLRKSGDDVKDAIRVSTLKRKIAQMEESIMDQKIYVKEKEKELESLLGKSGAVSLLSEAEKNKEKLKRLEDKERAKVEKQLEKEMKINAAKRDKYAQEQEQKIIEQQKIKKENEIKAAVNER